MHSRAGVISFRPRRKPGASRESTGVLTLREMEMAVQGSHQNQSTTAKLMDHGDSYRTPPRGMFGGRNN